MHRAQLLLLYKIINILLSTSIAVKCLFSKYLLYFCEQYVLYLALFTTIFFYSRFIRYLFFQCLFCNYIRCACFYVCNKTISNKINWECIARNEIQCQLFLFLFSCCFVNAHRKQNIFCLVFILTSISNPSVLELRVKMNRYTVM